MSTRALSNLNIVEWAEGISGPYCSKLLADLGAEVTKVEKPGGDRARSRGPFPDDIPHPERSGTFLYLNANKLGVTLDVSSRSGAEVFRRLIEGTDILIENHPPSEVEGLGFGYDNLKKVNPALVMTSLTAFGQTGPYRDYNSCNLVSFHASGMAYINPSDGVDDIEQEPPLMGPANQGDLVAGLTGALATMSAVFARRMTGSGQHVDLSQQEALASMTRHQLGNYIVENVPWIRLRAGRQDGVSEMYRCSDGLVYLMAGHQKSWQTWVDAMGNPEWAMGDLFQDQDSRRQNRDVLKMMIEGWTSQHTVAEVVRIAEASRVPCKPVNTVRESTNSELLAARGHFVDIHHGEAGNIKCPGAPYKLSRTPWRVKRPAPFLGEHNEEVFCGRLGYTRKDLTVMRAQGVI